MKPWEPAPEIEPADLNQELASAQPPVLLDVREAEERAAGYIPGSLHIPMYGVPRRLNELEKERLIVVYCAHGVRSSSVADFLIQQGYRALSLRGGIYGWLAVGGVIAAGRRFHSP